MEDQGWRTGAETRWHGEMHPCGHHITKLMNRQSRLVGHDGSATAPERPPSQVLMLGGRPVRKPVDPPTDPEPVALLGVVPLRRVRVANCQGLGGGEVPGLMADEACKRSAEIDRAPSHRSPNQGNVGAVFIFARYFISLLVSSGHREDRPSAQALGATVVAHRTARRSPVDCPAPTTVGPRGRRGRRAGRYHDRHTSPTGCQAPVALREHSAGGRRVAPASVCSPNLQIIYLACHKGASPS